MGKPIVAIVGRPNVGKSTLFNKLVGQRLAIVEDTPGVTRDRLYGNCEWQDHRFLLIDTGGIEPKADDVLLRHMRGQAQLAIDTADAILFVTDIRAGSGHRGHAHAQRQACVPCGKQGRRCGRAAHGTV